MTNSQLKEYSTWKVESVFSIIRNRTRMLILTTFIQHSFEVLVTAIRRKRKKSYSEKIILSLSAYDMILYTENPKDAIRKLLELTNKFR